MSPFRMDHLQVPLFIWKKALEPPVQDKVDSGEWEDSRDALYPVSDKSLAEVVGPRRLEPAVLP